MNWGRAMCLRAELADSDELAVQLYNSALDKFEAVLEEEPDMILAKYRSAAVGRTTNDLWVLYDSPMAFDSY